MIHWVFILLGAFYIVISVAFFIFGFNLYHLSMITHRHGKRKETPPKLNGEWPRVTVQLPIYNELYVAERLISVVAALQYPSEKLQIQVLDDSTDETKNLIANAVRRLQEEGVNIEHIHRINRTGFKAGALQNGLLKAAGEFIAIFDADFIPPEDFLIRTVPYLQNPKIAFVQTRWGHVNRNYSWFTRLQAIMIDAHFMVEQFGRSRGGYWFNFNGTAGIWRRQAMEDAGGWRADTLTEDLDLSYRAFLKGWEADYVREIEVPAELPVHFSGFRRQQHRWAKGSLECALNLVGRVCKSQTSLAVRLQALIHLSGYGVHLLLFITLLIYPGVVKIGLAYPRFQYLYGFSFLLGITAFAPTLFFVLGQIQLKRLIWRQVPMILLVSIIGSGMMFNTTRATWQIFSGRKDVFERTAKFGIETKQQNWKAKRYQLRFDSIVYYELFFGMYALFTGVTALQNSNWGVGFYALFFATGLLLVSTITIVETIAIRHYREARKHKIAVENAQWSIH